MPTQKIIPVTNLLVDHENPRLHKPEYSNSREAIRAVAAAQGEKITTLAENIVEHGINPAALPIVMPAPGDENSYIVLEGNRRISALYALENPDLLEGAVDPKIVQRIRKLSERYLQNPLEEVPCVVYESDKREEADFWIELRHTGENKGAGLVTWDAQAVARFQQRRKGKNPYSMQALDFLEQHGYISSEVRENTPLTSLRRILSSPENRERLGLEMEGGILYTQYPADEVAKGLRYIVEDLASGRIRTGNIYHKDQRVNYVKGIPTEHLPTQSTAASELHDLGSFTPDSEDEAEDDKKPTSRRRSTRPSRKYLIPRGFSVCISDPRINEIYRELRRLPLEKFPNAIGVLFRVFIELSVDAYLTRESVGIDQSKSLYRKVDKTASHLEGAGKITPHQASAIRHIAQQDTYLAGSVNTFHGYVHNRSLTPTVEVLKSAWQSLEPFIEALWSG